jgi:hypothetical protein
MVYLRRIAINTTEDCCWRIKTSQEINDILKGQNIIGFIKTQRLNWLGHVEGMAENNIVQSIKGWKHMSKRPTGRPKTRWEDDVMEDIKNIGRMSLRSQNLKKEEEEEESGGGGGKEEESTQRLHVKY